MVQVCKTLVRDVEEPETTYLLHCKILDASPNQQNVIHAVDQWFSVVGLGLVEPESRLKRGPSDDVIILSQP